MSFVFFFFKQKTAYEMRISDWSSDVCSSDLGTPLFAGDAAWKTDASDGADAQARQVGDNHDGIHFFPIEARASPIDELCRKRSSALGALPSPLRSEERRVGKEGVRTFRSRWSPYH